MSHPTVADAAEADRRYDGLLDEIRAALPEDQRGLVADVDFVVGVRLAFERDHDEFGRGLRAINAMTTELLGQA